MIDVSIIIVSFNTNNLTIECIKSVYTETNAINYEIIVVDNNSTDNSVESILKHFPDIRILALKENIGFSAANNLAVKESKGKYILLLNPDTLILENSIKKIYNFAYNHPENLIYGGRTFNERLELNPTSCWKKPTLWSLLCNSIGLSSIFRNNNIFDQESYGAWKRDTIREVDIVAGCFLLIEKRLWDLLNGFDNTFFMYGEDADLCLRAKKYGAKPIIYPEAKIIHYCGASEKIRSEKMIRLLHAKELFINKHFKNNQIEIAKLLLRLSVLNRLIIFSILNFFKFSREKYTCWKKIWDSRNIWFIR